MVVKTLKFPIRVPVFKDLTMSLQKVIDLDISNVTVKNEVKELPAEHEIKLQSAGVLLPLYIQSSSFKGLLQ